MPPTPPTPPTPGAPSAHSPGVLDAVRAAGWDTVELDLTGVRDKAAFLTVCARSLALPPWFGHNWDALADCLRDLSWARPAPARLLLVSHWQPYARTAPEEWRTAQDILAEAVAHWRERATPLSVLLALG